ncbi:unnamed protein product, partial [Musa textilis]
LNPKSTKGREEEKHGGVSGKRWLGFCIKKFQTRALLHLKRLPWLVQMEEETILIIGILHPCKTVFLLIHHFIWLHHII